MSDNTVVVTHGVGSVTLQPIVVLHVKELDAMYMEVPKAREIAHMLLAEADAAVVDAFLVTFLAERLGMDESQADGVLRDFYAWRAERESRAGS